MQQDCRHAKNPKSEMNRNFGCRKNRIDPWSLQHTQLCVRNSYTGFDIEKQEVADLGFMKLNQYNLVGLMQCEFDS